MPTASAVEVLSRGQVIEAIGELEQAVLAWEQDDKAPLIAFAGGMVKAPNEAIELLSMRLFHLCDTMDAEDIAKPLILAVDHFEDELRQWALGRRDTPTVTAPGGSEAMWSAYRTMLARRTPRRDKQPEPIKNLLAAEVSPRQVALTYGFFEEGEPCMRMVFEEQAKPGTHYNPDTWVSPAHRTFLRKIEKQWALRQERAGRFSDMVEGAEALEEIRQQQRKHAKPTPEAPEPLDNLIRDSVPLAQILRMKPKETEESVLRRAAELGVALDADAWSYYNRQRPKLPAEVESEKNEAFQQAMRAAEVNTFPELGQRDERIMAMHNDGHNSTEIARYLSEDYVGLSRQRVASVIRAASESEQQGRQDGLGQAETEGQPES